MSLGRASFFVPGERSLFHASLLIGKRSLLNIIKVSGNENFATCDTVSITDVYPGTQEWMEQFIRESYRRKGKQKKNSSFCLSKRLHGIRAAKFRWVKSDGKNPQEL